MGVSGWEKEGDWKREREGVVKQMCQNCIPTMNMNSLCITHYWNIYILLTHPCGFQIENPVNHSLLIVKSLSNSGEFSWYSKPPVNCSICFPALPIFEGSVEGLLLKPYWLMNINSLCTITDYLETNILDFKFSLNFFLSFSAKISWWCGGWGEISWRTNNSRGRSYHRCCSTNWFW